MNTLNATQSREMEKTLMGLLGRAEAKAVFLTDRGGNIIVCHTSANYQHEDNIAALAAGSFYATRELAKLLGEPEFQCVFHQGTDASVYMQSTASELLVLVVFDQESNPGLVKLYANETCHAIDRFLKRQEKNGAANEGLALHFEIDSSKQLFKRAYHTG